MLVLALASLSYADCDQLLELSVNQAERSFAVSNTTALDQALKDARKALPCVKDPLSTEQVARMHRVEALSAFLRGNEDRSLELLRAAVHADPWLRTEGVFGERDDLEAMLVSAEESDPSRTADIDWPQTGHVLVDGTSANRAPVEHPWIWQQIDADGQVAGTAWVETGGSPPTLTGQRSSGKGTGLVLAGLGSGVVAGALYGVAWTQRTRYDQAVIAQDEPTIRAAHAATNGLSAGAVAAAGVGGALFVVGITR